MGGYETTNRGKDEEIGHSTHLSRSMGEGNRKKWNIYLSIRFRGRSGENFQLLRTYFPVIRNKMFRLSWNIYVPHQNRTYFWERKSTVPIYKKDDLTDFSNFRPISLLPTIYKIFSGVISSCIMAITTRLGWMSPEQKGFLPSVRGIQQEPTHILQAVIEESKRKRRDMVIAWLDLSNAFGSAPHPILNSLFQSLHWHYIHRARLGILPIKWKP